jgi:hypothetical protein
LLKAGAVLFDVNRMFRNVLEGFLKERGIEWSGTSSSCYPDVS